MSAKPDLRLVDLFRTGPVRTLEEIRRCVDGLSWPAIYRRLKRLGYRTSYNHNARYYALIPEDAFDRWGLWSHRGVRFSREGTLSATVRRLAAQAEAGWTRRELEELLGVRVQTVLRTLLQRGELAREKVGPAYVYGVPQGLDAQLARRRERHASVQRRSEVPLETVVAVLRTLVHHPGSEPASVVRRLKGHSPPIHLPDVEEVFDRYELGQKKGRSRS